MQITIKATGIELTQAITNYVNEKIGGLEKYLKRLKKAFLVVMNL